MKLRLPIFSFVLLLLIATNCPAFCQQIIFNKVIPSDDIWGDTVNLAARMEQSGVPGKINISQHTYELIKEQFTCVQRRKIEAKNKGEIDMYFVEPTKINLS